MTYSDDSVRTFIAKYLHPTNDAAVAISRLMIDLARESGEESTEALGWLAEYLRDECGPHQTKENCGVAAIERIRYEARLEFREKVTSSIKAKESTERPIDYWLLQSEQEA